MRLWLALMVGWAAAALTAPPVWAKERTAGLDVVVLVDVSGSMFEYPKTETSPRRDGNDRERLRWDAVKLVIDLLGEEDRIAILPFNAYCPARQDEQPQSQRLPGKLPDRLDPLTDRYRNQLSQEVLSFIAEDNGRPYDWGSTGILDALGAARDRIQKGRRPNRKAVVILLTDGEQDTGSYRQADTPDDKLVAGGGWVNDQRVFFFREEGIKVYSFGLGQNADMGFLRKLALDTNSGALPVPDNGALVKTFRSLIWSLRGCWPDPIDPGNPDTLSSRSLKGVLELGVSLSELETRPAKQRNTFSPSTPPRQVWSDGEPATPKWRALGKEFTLNGRRRTSGHAYSFYDGRETGRDPLGALFQRHPQRELTLDFDGAAQRERVSGFWVKRPDLDFELTLPAVTFYRHQPIPVGVRMYDWGDHFVSDDFEVTARIVSADDPSQRFAAVLQAVGGDTFKADSRFTAASLSPSTAFQDSYTLEVEVRNPKLSRASYPLPHRSIIIKNVLPLLPPDPGLALHREKQVLSPIQVEPKFPVRDNLSLLMETVAPKATGNQPPLAEDLFEYGPSTTGDDRRINFPGRVSLGVRLREGRQVPKGVYAKGEFRLRAAPETNLRLAVWGAREKEEREGLYVVPFGLRMDTIGIGFNSATRPLSVGPRRPQDSLVVALKQIDGPRPAPGQPTDPNRDQSLTLEITPRDPKQVVFAVHELWVQPSGDGPVESAARRTSSRLKQIGEPIQLFFQPDPSKHTDHHLLIGEHTYLLKASGPRFDPVEQEVTLIVQPPQLEARPPRHDPLYAKRGGVTPAVRFQARLDWLPGGRLDVLLRGYPKIRFLDLSTDSIVGDNYELTYRGLQKSVLSLQAPGSPDDDGWTDLEFELAVPADMRFGNYEGRLELALQNRLLRALEIPLNVDAIYLLHPVIPADKQRRFRDMRVTEFPVARRSSELKLTQYFDHPANVTVEIRSELAGNPLTPAHLEVTVAPVQGVSKIPCLVNANDPTDYVRAPAASPARLVDGNLQVDLKFPEIRNATPGTAYTGTLLLTYRDPAAVRDLGQRSVPISVTFVEARDVIRTGSR